MSFAAQPNPMLGIGLKVASVSSFLAMATFIKAAEGIPPGELVFFRSFIAIAPILVFLKMRGELRGALRTARPFVHVLRGLLGVSAMSLMFLALTRLPLPEATMINYTIPLWLVILSALVLGETVRTYRWAAVVVGLAGVLVIVWPRLSLITAGEPLGAAETVGVAAALAGTLFAAFAQLTARDLVRTENSATVVLYFSIIASIAALATMPFGWTWPQGWHWVLLVGAGIVGGIGQIFLTESYRYADVSVIAPFEYSSMILSIVVGYLVFGDVPTLNMIAGGLIVVAAGIFIIERERRLGLDRAARRYTTPQG